MRLVHTGAYALLLPTKTRLYRLPPKKDYHVHTTRSIYHYAYARQTQVNLKKETMNKQDETRKKSKEKRRKARKRLDKKKRQGKEKRKNVILADPSN